METRSLALHNENEASALPFVDQEDIHIHVDESKVNSNCLLRITIIEGTWLEDADFFGKQDPLIQFEHNGQIYKTQIAQDAGKHAVFNQIFELYGLDKAIKGPPLVIGSYDDDPAGVELLGNVRPIEYRELFESTEELKHNMEMFKEDGGKAGKLIFKTHYMPALGDDQSSKNSESDKSVGQKGGNLLMQGLDKIRQAKKKRQLFKIQNDQLIVKDESDDEKSEEEAKEPGLYDKFIDFQNQAKDKNMEQIKDLIKQRFLEIKEQKMKEKAEYEALPEEEKKKLAAGFFKRIIEKVIELNKKVKAFRLGIAFFAYNGKCLKAIENHYAPPGTKRKPPPTITRKNKIDFIKGMIAVYFLVKIGTAQLDKLGKEKSQSLEYFTRSNLTYNITDVPKLIPMHQYTFFDKEEVKDRLKCRLYNDLTECKKIATKKCEAKGETRQKYEECMIDLNGRLGQNTTQFCVNHYNRFDIWTEELTPEEVLYYERKHSCLQASGKNKGRQYCKDMKEYSIGWTKDNLYSCYMQNKVDYTKEKCDDIFGTSDMQSLLKCYGASGGDPNQNFCDVQFPIEDFEDRGALQRRSDCYATKNVKNKAACDLNSLIYFWRDQRLQACYVQAGYKLDKKFCDDNNPESQIDKRYKCYQVIGLGIELDREYCEIKWGENSMQKYRCIDIINRDKLAKVEDYCQNEFDPTDDFLQNECIIDQNQTTPYIVKGQDFCFSTQMWDSDHEDLYNCLSSEGFEKDALYCEIKYRWQQRQAELYRDPSLFVDSEMYQCQFDYGFIPNNDQSDNNCTFLTELKSTTVYKSDEITFEILKDKNTDPSLPTFYEQSQFSGSTLKFYKEDQELTYYAIIHDVPYAAEEDNVYDADWSKYGTVDFVLGAPRNQMGIGLPQVGEQEIPGSLLGLKKQGWDASQQRIIDWIDQQPEIMKFTGYWHFETENQVNLHVEPVGPILMRFDPETQKMNITMRNVTYNETLNNDEWKNASYEDALADDEWKALVVQGWSGKTYLKNYKERIGFNEEFICTLVPPDSSWKADLGEEKIVQRIDILNIPNGNQTSNLENAEIYVDDQLCARIGPTPPNHQMIEIVCEDPTRQRQNRFRPSYDPTAEVIPFDGLTGQIISIKAKKAQGLQVCNVKLYAKFKDLPAIKKLEDGKLLCRQWQEQCDQLTGENYYVCKERYAVPKTAQYCVDQLRAQSSSFYALKNKYDCMVDPKNSFPVVTLPNEVNECLLLYFEFKVEQCLQTYENRFLSQMGFIGGNGQPEHPKYYHFYGNLTQDIKEKQAAEKAAQEAAEFEARANMQTTVPLEKVAPDLSDEVIQRYLCEQSRMFFYMNPYDDALMDPSAKQEDVIIDLDCLVFNFFDALTGRDMSVQHYFMEDPELFWKVTSSIPEEEQKLLVNKTELNTQFFQYEQTRSLEYLEVQKTQYYLKSQDPQIDEIQVPKPETTEDYYAFISNSFTLKLAETVPYNVAKEKIEPTILDASPEKNIYTGKPKKGAKKYNLGVGEYSFAFVDLKEVLIKVKPENNLRVSDLANDDEQARDKYPQILGLRFGFIEQQFSYTYFSTTDLISELGGISGIVGGLFASIGFLFIMLYVSDLVNLIQRKFVFENNKFIIRYHVMQQKNLEKFRMTIEGLMEREKAKNPKASAEEEGSIMKKLTDDLALLDQIELWIWKSAPELLQKSKRKERKEEFDAKAEAKQKKQEEKESKMSLVERAIAQVKPPPPTPEEEEEIKKQEEYDALFADYQELYKILRKDITYLDKSYHHYFRDFGIQEEINLFDDFKLLSNIYEKRTMNSFMFVAQKIKNKVSFYGIYIMNERADLQSFRLEILRKKVQIAVQYLLDIQNNTAKLLDQASTHRMDRVNEKFVEMEEEIGNQKEKSEKKKIKMENQSKKYVDKLNVQLQRLIAYVEENNRKQTQKELNQQFQKLRELQKDFKNFKEELERQDFYDHTYKLIFQTNEASFIPIIRGLDDTLENISYQSHTYKLPTLVSAVNQIKLDKAHIKLNVLEMLKLLESSKQKWVECEQILKRKIKEHGPFEFENLDICDSVQASLSTIIQGFTKAIVNLRTLL